jgi:O-antigen/teichoic acid export membrane protein
LLIRNTAWSLLAQVLRLVTALLLIALLDPAARGLQTLLVLVPTLLGSLTLFGVGNAAPVVLHRGVGESRLLANLMGLGLCVVAALGVVLLPTLPLLARFLSSPDGYVVSSGDILVGLLLLPPTLLGDYLRSLLAARRDLRQVALSQIVQAVAQLVFAVLLVLLLQLGPLGAVWAAVLGGWCGFAWVLRVVQPLGSLRPRLESDVVRLLLGLGLRGHIGNVVQTFNYRLDVLLVQAFQNQAAVGLYQTGVLLAEMVWYLPNAVSAALLPQIAATRDATTTPRVARHTLLLTTAGAIGLIAVAWPGLAWLRPAYLPAVAPMSILLIGVVALSIHKVLASDLSGRGLPLYPSLTSTLALVVTLVADLLLIPRYGIVGAAWASTLAYTVQTVALVLIYLRVTHAAWRDLFVLRGDDLRIYRRWMLKR